MQKGELSGSLADRLSLVWELHHGINGHVGLLKLYPIVDDDIPWYSHISLYIHRCIYLVGGLEHFLFFHILGIIIPTDELIFFRGVGIPPTRYIYIYIFPIYLAGFGGWKVEPSFGWVVFVAPSQVWWTSACRISSARTAARTAVTTAVLRPQWWLENGQFIDGLPGFSC